MDLTVLYEDDDCLAVDKPEGLLSVPGRGPGKGDCVVSRAADEYTWIREVHRLDQATSGVMLLAKNAEAHRRYSEIFAARRPEKTYLAVTLQVPTDPERPGVVFFSEGHEANNSGTITLRQRLDPEHRPWQVVDSEKGKEAVTPWQEKADHRLRLDIFGAESGDRRPETATSNYKVLYLRPSTGRTHQLRLALSVCNAAILGDRLYAPAGIRDAAPRLLLHAVSLRVPRIHNQPGDIDIVSAAPFVDVLGN